MYPDVAESLKDMIVSPTEVERTGPFQQCTLVSAAI